MKQTLAWRDKMLQEAGVRAFVLKDDAGGMEPQLQLTGGVRLFVSQRGR